MAFRGRLLSRAADNNVDNALNISMHARIIIYYYKKNGNHFGGFAFFSTNRILLQYLLLTPNVYFAVWPCA